jgi:hypothetical protein
MDINMRGKNTFIISPEEMKRAVEKYFKELIGVMERENSIVMSVRQKGAKPESPFIIEIDEKKVAVKK